MSCNNLLPEGFMEIIESQQIYTTTEVTPVALIFGIRS